MKRFLPYLALAALALIVLPSILTPGKLLCTAVDAGASLYRLHEISWLFDRGILWPRWAPNWSYGYGYPIFTFYGSLAFYPALILHQLGVSLVGAFQAGFWLALVFSGWAAFVWLRSVLGDERAALVGATAYMFVPYHLNATVYRINLPEPWAFVWAPLAFYGLHRLSARFDWRSVALTALAAAALPLTSSLAAVVFAPLLLAYALFLLAMSDRRVALFGRLLASAALTLGLAIFFLLPAWINRTAVQIERGFSAGGTNVFRQFLPLSRVFQQPLLADVSRANPLYDPLSLGWIVPLASVAVLAAGWKRLSRPLRWHALWAAAVGLICVLLATRIAAPLYRALTFLQVLQFGWRFLGPATLVVALLAAVGARAWIKNTVPCTIVALVVALTGWPLLYPGLFCPLNPNPTLHDAVAAQVGMVGTLSTNAEYLPVAVREIPRTSPMFDDYMDNAPVVRWDESRLPEGGRTLAIGDDGLRARWQIDTPAPFEAVYQAFAFPGWQASVDGQRVDLHVVAPYGLIGVDVPAGAHTVDVRFGPLPGQRVGEIVSAASVLVLTGLLFWPSRVRPHESTGATTRDCPYYVWAAAAMVGVLLWALRVAVVDPLDGPPRIQRFDGTQVRGVEYPLNVSYDGGLRLLGFNLIGRPASGGALHLDLYWASASGAPFRAFLRLVDEQGAPWTDWNTIVDFPGLIGPPGPALWDGRYTSLRYQIDIPPGTPPGTYHLSVAAVDPDTLGNYFVVEGVSLNAERTEAVIGEIEIGRRAVSVVEATRLAQPGEAISIDDALSLVRCDLSRDTATVGETVSLTPLWYARACPSIRDYTLRLANPSGEYVWQETLPLSARYGVEQWKAGELVRAPVEVLLPAHLPVGNYRWSITVGQLEIPLGSLAVSAPQRQTRFPPDIIRVGQTLGGFAELIGYQADDLQPGQPLSLTLYWRVQAETATSYKVFVHLLDAQGRPLAQSDAVPARWTRPTTGWLPPEVIADAHTLSIPAGLAPGQYHLVAGLYDPASGRRAATPEGVEQIGLGEQSVP